MSALDLEGLEFAPPGEETGQESGGGAETEVYNAQLEGLDLESKEAVLIETFPGLKPFDIKWTLNKCKGNAGLAIDELLHQVFLEENGGRRKGIEAFSESDLPERPKKGKGKKKRSRLISEVSSNSGSEAASNVPLESKWDSGRRDIEFITTKTGMPMSQVSSIYHKHGATVPGTLNAIIDAHVSFSLEPADPMVDIHAADLSTEFPSIPAPRIHALVELTHPSTSSAHELAKALTARPNRIASPIQIDIRLPPLNLDHSTTDQKSKPKSESYNTSSSFTPPVTSTAAGDPDYYALRHNAFTQARVAHRAAKSNPLMGGAASYYSSLGRDYSTRAAAQTSAAADALVASQSSNLVLDLHGVNVKDGVRIAREGVTGWWVGTRGSGGSYKIVTGKGTHSEGGRSKLGPAVGGMLIREGWKVQAGSGALLVMGVVGKRK